MYRLLSTKVLFSVKVSMLYGLTFAIIFYILQPPPIIQKTAYATTTQEKEIPPPSPSKPAAVSGQPIKIVIADSLIDLQVIRGDYDSNSRTWTLSDTQVQYATMTSPPNDQSGNTFIYGHGTDQVLGKLVNTPPIEGSIAHVYTDNGHILSYAYQGRRELTESDTTIFNYRGPSILTIQTCTGIFSEWRTMFEFKFDRVIQ